jgi:hypothetical protein
VIGVETRYGTSSRNTVAWTSLPVGATTGYDAGMRTDPLVRECWFVTCGEPAAYEAIGAYNDVFGIDETVALVLCVGTPRFSATT